MAYVSTSILHRDLDDQEEAKFRKYAQDNDPPNLESWEAYHPVCREEWIKRGIEPPARSC